MGRRFTVVRRSWRRVWDGVAVKETFLIIDNRDETGVARSESIRVGLLRFLSDTGDRFNGVEGHGGAGRKTGRISLFWREKFAFR